MKNEIKVPAMGESITEATVGAFLKATGSFAQSEEEIIELETEKVNQVLYAPFAGTVSWIVKEGDRVKIGDVLGTIDSEAVPEEKKAAQPPPESSPPPAQMGEGKRLMKEAFIASLNAPPEAKQQPQAAIQEGRETRKPMTKIRKTIGRRLVESLHNAAMLTTFNEVDMSAILALRGKYKESFLEKHGVKLGFMSFFVRAVVEGLKKYPDFNSYISGEEIVERHYYDIGIAVGTEKGLVVPVIRGCDHLSFAQIEKEIVHFAKKAREGRLAIEDLEGGGFTITNGGIYGSLLSTPILNPPQVGILGMHKILERPVAVEKEVVIRPMMYLALSYDHRIVDGKGAVSFLVHVKELLEDPARFIIDGTL